MRFSRKPMTFRRMSCSRSTNIGKYRNHLWFVVFVCFLSWMLWLYLHYLAKLDGKNGILLPVNTDSNDDDDDDDSNDIDSSVRLSNESTRILPNESINEETRIGETDKITENKQDPVVGVQEVKPNNEPTAPENRRKPGIREGDRIQEMQPQNESITTENKQVLLDEVVKENVVEQGNAERDTIDFDSDICSGRYVYIHNLPSRFNEDMLKNCKSLSKWTDMCLYLSNMGLGPRLSNSERAFSNTGWFGTNQFSLEVIFHNRMKQYDCLTSDSSMASAIFVPFYAGLDVARYLWYDKEQKDTASTDLSRWLSEQPEWKDMWGRNHFAVAGRISWDFRRQTKILSQWGNGLMYLPAFKNMTMLTIESSPWHRNDFGVPYPTYFHPSNDKEVHQWQSKMRRQRRRYLFSFAGAPRPNLPDSIRNQIIDQCSASRRKCKLLECGLVGSKCHRPANVMKMFQTSIFCLQPPGDSYTRRSAFDSILAGCIPVFFHPGSAYVQYLWHLPKNYSKYSVFIPGNSIKKGNVSIEKTLQRIPRHEVVAMREEVIRLIPKVIYANPKSRLETDEDAFDIAVRSVLERVEIVRKDMKGGRNSSFAFDEEMSWKYYLMGTDSAKHEWDPFFDKRHTNF